MQGLIATGKILFRLFLVVFLMPFNTKAQIINKVSIQASGLTCSMCSNAIYKGLLTVAYVDRVDVDIKDSKFDINFKPMAQVSFDELKDKVESAGFFVANMEVTYSLEQFAAKDEDHISIDGKLFHFMNLGNHTFSGNMKLRIIDKGFVTAKEYKKNAKYTEMSCYHTGHVGSCCKQDTQVQGTRIYHVTI